MSSLAVIFVLGLLVLVHEAGHLLAAKLTGIPVARFSVGFGRKLAGFEWRGTEYRLSLIPLGGYVMPGVATESEYLAVPLHKRIVFALGGPVANILFVLPMLAAVNLLRGHVSAYAVFIAPFSQLGGMTLQMLTALTKLFSEPTGISGVVGIVANGGEFIAMSAVRAFFFTAILSLNLAVFNLLPLPPLDGGKILLDSIQRVFPGARKAYLPVVLAGWLMMLGLMIYATTLDIGRIVT